MHDDLGVAARVKAVTERNQFRNQLLVVVDLAVEHHTDALVLVVERLLPGGQVDDRQPPVTESEPGLDVQAALIRATMVLRFVHPRQNRTVNMTLTTGIENSGNAAHIEYPSSRVRKTTGHAPVACSNDPGASTALCPAGADARPTAGQRC